MHNFLTELTEIVILVAASILWTAAEEPVSLVFAITMALTFGGGAWFLLGWLVNRLPNPRTACETVCAFTRALALIVTFFGIAASYALGCANEAVATAITNLRKECYERNAGAWQGATFRLAAERVAALGPEYAASSDNALHGGLTLPIKDARAAQVIAEVYADQAQARVLNDSQTAYRLLSYLLPEVQKTDIRNIPLPSGETVITAKPDPNSFVGLSINAGLMVTETALLWKIEEYVALQQWKLCAPALFLWALAFVIVVWTAMRRINRQAYLLDYHHKFSSNRNHTL